MQEDHAKIRTVEQTHDTGGRDPIRRRTLLSRRLVIQVDIRRFLEKGELALQAVSDEVEDVRSPLHLLADLREGRVLDLPDLDTLGCAILELLDGLDRILGRGLDVLEIAGLAADNEDLECLTVGVDQLVLVGQAARQDQVLRVAGEEVAAQAGTVRERHEEEFPGEVRQFAVPIGEEQVEAEAEVGDSPALPVQLVFPGNLRGETLVSLLERFAHVLRTEEDAVEVQPEQLQQIQAAVVVLTDQGVEVFDGQSRDV